MKPCTARNPPRSIPPKYANARCVWCKSSVASSPHGKQPRRQRRQRLGRDHQRFVQGRTDSPSETTAISAAVYPINGLYKAELIHRDTIWVVSLVRERFHQRFVQGRTDSPSGPLEKPGGTRTGNPGMGGLSTTTNGWNPSAISLRSRLRQTITVG